MLRALVPHILKDRKIALVRSEQGFYNLPARLNGTFATVMRATEPAEDVHSGFLIRREALEDIGGFPTASSIEDGQLTALLRGKGYQTRFVTETLQFGLVSDCLATQVRQRIARSLGPIRTAKRLRFFTRGPRIAQLVRAALHSARADAHSPFSLGCLRSLPCSSHSSALTC